MILYNTSFHVEASIESEFLNWLKDEVLTKFLNVGFTAPMLTRLLVTVDPACSSFAMQFLADDKSVVERWENEGGSHVIEDMHRRWGERVLAFSTPMEVISL